MKLAHVSFRSLSGVIHKTQGLAKAAKEMGLSIEFIILSDVEHEDDKNIKFYRLNLPRNRFLRKLFLDYFRYQTINRSVDLSAYDRIILRYPGSIDLAHKSFFDKYKNKIITEHHSIVETELKALEVGRLNPVRILLERFNAPKILSYAIGIIGVTEEIKRKQLEILAHDRPSMVISNSLDVESVKMTRFKPFDGRSLNMISVSTTFFPWQGLDRLVEAMKAYQGKTHLNLNLVGNFEASSKLKTMKETSIEQGSIHVLGEVHGERLDEYFSKANLAVSTLALHRKKLTDACPIKTREYVARGIPFIYAYNDVDIQGEPDFALKFDCCDEPLDMNSIIAFAQNVSRKERLSERMREYAFKHLDSKTKVKKMYEFALSIGSSG